MAEIRTDAETPTLQVNLDHDPLRADHQLQQALRLNASRDSLHNNNNNTTTTPNSRKHARSTPYADINSDIDATESDYVSDVSGKFDDADELEFYGYRTPGTTGYGGYEYGYDETYNSPAHSAKRRRSNDWSPMNTHNPSNDTGQSPRYNDNKGSSGRRWRLNHSRGSPRATTTTNAMNKNSSLPRGRRSRFIEGTMNDSVSEKPPSIFLRDGDDLEHHGHEEQMGKAGNKSSGIFRFGKAIASAFNPFGGWGTVSDAWRGSGSAGTGSVEDNSHQNLNLIQGYRHQQQEDDIARVQRAYEELKRSGFKGTVKGSYTQGGVAQNNSSAIPEETWKAIQSKMDHKQPTAASAGRTSQMSGDSQETTTGAANGGGASSIRSSWSDLRKAKSSLGITSVKERRSEDSECLGDLRKQKSRKDLLRQTKLLKKVSNLEDKLNRARHELRELRGQQQQEGDGEDLVPPVPVVPAASASVLPAMTPPEPSSHHEYYPKKFVPGALPTLPSERCLEEQDPDQVKTPEALPAMLSEPPVERQYIPAPAPVVPTVPSNSAPLQTLSPNITRDNPTPDAKEAKQSLSHLLATDSPSLKRKSPDPEALEAEALAASESKENEHSNESNEPAKQPTPRRNNDTPRTRRSKSHKRQEDDSPGSVELKQKTNSTSTPRRRKRSHYLNPTSPRSSPSARRSQPGTPSLRLRKGYANLRSASPDTDDSEIEGGGEDLMDCDTPYNQQRQSFYMQGQQQLDPDSQQQETTPSRPKTRYEYIPPVPPLPKDIAETAARVDRRLAKELGRRREKQRASSGGGGSGNGQQMQMKEKEGRFEWPEGIF